VRLCAADFLTADPKNSILFQIFEEAEIKAGRLYLILLPITSTILPVTIFLAATGNPLDAAPVGPRAIVNWNYDWTD